MLIIVPAFNEEHRLNSNEFVKFAKSNTSFNFLFVNDGSSDNTKDILNSLCTKCPEQISALNLKQNVGKAEAVRQGMNYSLKTYETEQFFAFFDADLATPLSELLRMQDYLKDKEICCLMGTRFLHLGADIKRKAYRHYLGRVFATIVSIMLNLSVYDTQCGLKIFSRDIISEVFSKTFVSKWFFDVECLFRISKIKTSKVIHEFPLRKWEDVQGSKLRLSDFLSTPFELLKIYIHYK
jgi:glycosyltransferase involved in cell wall biosynthesis